MARADVRAGRDARPRLATSRSRARRSPRWRSPGSRVVGEFHYLHHGPAAALRRPERDGRALIAGRAPRPGIRITLLDACYLHGGHRRAAWSSGVRDATPTRGRERVDALADARAGCAIGAAIHSVRAVDSESATVGRRVGGRARRAAARPRLRAAGRERGLPRGARAARRPLCSPTPARSARAFTAVHATHLTDDDVALLGGSRASASARRPSATSPTASGRPRRCARRARRSALGSRLARGHRPVRGGARGRARRAARDRRARPPPRRRSCCAAATAGGYDSLGWPDGGRIAAGALADLVNVVARRRRAWPARRPSTRVEASSSPPAAATSATSWSAAAGSSPRRGSPRRTHRRRRRAATRDEAVWPMSTLVVDNIGLLVTNDPTSSARARSARPRRRARDRGRRGRRGRAGRRAGRRAHRRRRALRDPRASSTATRTSCSPATARDEFAARMAGAPYEAGGIRVTTAATRAASDDELDARSPRARRDEALPRRASRTSRSSRATGSTSTTERAAAARSPREFTDDVTFLGAHVVPAEFEGRADDYVALVCGEMLAAVRAARAAGSTSSASRARSTPTSRAPCSHAGRDAGLGLRVHGNQLGHGPGRAARGRAGRRVGRPLHLPHRRRHRRRSPASDTVATFLPATDFSTRQPYPDARRAIDAGVERSRSPRTATPARATRPRWRSASRSPCATCA